MSRQGQRPPGRPAAAEREPLEARLTLVETAARLFAEQGFDATSLKQVAAGAGVTPAMIAYYFDDKSGLLEAVVRLGLETLLESIEEVVADDADEPFVSRLVSSYVSTLSSAPWIPQVILREVISKDSPLRDVFVREFAGRAATLVPERVRQEVARGALRADLEPRFIVLSLVGMCVFPFIAAPVVGPLLGYEIDAEFSDAYGRHVADLFTNGAGVTR